MRTSLLVIAALATLSTSALAQDRTLPAGAYLAAQPPIDTVESVAVVPAAPAIEGRSVVQDKTPVAHKRSHRHD